MPTEENYAVNKLFSIGIDFGTTKSALAYTRLKDPRPQPAIGTHRVGIEFMPTVVLVTKDGQKLVGKKAENISRNTQANVGQLLRDFKLRLGDPDYSSFLRRRFGLDGAYELAALIIYVLKSAAEQFELTDERRILEAVITHPAGWGHEKKEDLIKAANIAGIENPILLKEPTAALYEIDRHRRLSEESARVIVVLDYGGGTCDVTVCRTLPGSFLLAREPEILSEHTEHFGGRDVDKTIADWLNDEFHRQHPGLPADCLSNYEGLLRQRAKEQKEKFTDHVRQDRFERQYLRSTFSTPAYTFEIPHLYGNRSLKVTWTKNLFGEIIWSEIKRLVDPIIKALKKADLERKDVQMVALVGGSSLLPTIEKQVHDMFSPYSVEIYMPPQPRHAVAYGASIFHYYEKNPGERSPVEGRKRYATLRIGLDKDETFVLVQAGESIPVKRRVWECKTPRRNMRYVDILILEGDRKKMPENEPYAWKRFDFGKPVPKGARIVIEYEIDKQDIFSMYAFLKDNPEINSSIVGRQSISPEDIISSRRRLELPNP